MSDTDYLAHLMHQTRVNEAAIFLLASKLGVDPGELFDDAATGVNSILEKGGFNDAAS